MALDSTKNFWKWTVSTWYDSSATSIVLESGHWTRFPQPSTDWEFNVVWWSSSEYGDPSDDSSVEIVRCTARTDDTLTVTRAQEWTAASNKNTLWAVYTMALVMTSKMIDDIETDLWTKVVWPASATDNAIARYHETTWKIVQDSWATIDDSGNIVANNIASGATVSGSNTGDQDLSGYMQDVVEDTTPQLGGQLDVNGQALGDGTLELLKFEETASAVNEFTIKNAATGGAPELQSTGDDTNIDLKLTPKGTGIVKGEIHTATFVLKDKYTSLAIGTGIGGDFRIPGNRAITVKSVGAYTDTASATGSNKLTIDINEAGTSILSTKITLDVGEKTSQTAATAPVISDASIAADAIITFDIDQVNETTPDKGLKVYIEFIYA